VPSGFTRSQVARSNAPRSRTALSDAFRRTAVPFVHTCLWARQWLVARLSTPLPPLFAHVRGLYVNFYSHHSPLCSQMCLATAAQSSSLPF